MKVIFSLLFFFGLIQFANSQDSNHVSIEQLGISFDIPLGWQGQEFNEGILLQHSSIPGVIFISTHNYSKAQLLQDAQNGMTDSQGTNLKLAGNVDELSATAIGGNYEGFLEGNATRAYIIGVENPYQGLGVIILAATTPDVYTDQLKEASLELFKSIEFKKVETSESLAEWKTWLAGKRLRYFERYNSPSTFDGGTSGSYSINRTIDLCPQGYFIFGNDNNFQMEGQGNNQDKSRGSGTWEVVTGSDGYPSLKLFFHTGEESFYRLEYSEDKLFLNGERYYREEGKDLEGFCR